MITELLFRPLIHGETTHLAYRFRMCKTTRMRNIIRGKVRDLTVKGLGVVDHPDGGVLFVPGAWPGDEGSFMVEWMDNRYGKASVVEVDVPSMERVMPLCPHQGYGHGACGGCSWMIGSYESQLRSKEKIVKHALQRAGFSPGETGLQPILGAERYWGYRNRAQFKTDGEEIGFVSAASHILVPVKDCLVLSDANRRLLYQLRRRLPNPQWRPKGGFLWNFIEIDENSDPDQLVINERRFFQQANAPQNEKIKTWLKEQLRRHALSETMLELFAGDGNLTRAAAAVGFTRIIAVDISGCPAGRKTAMDFPAVRMLETDLYHLPDLHALRRHCQSPRILLLDPPRAGFRYFPRLLNIFPEIQIIYYVSCHLGTFVRDACALRRRQWMLAEVQPLDMFPHTPHIEILSRFEKQGRTSGFRNTDPPVECPEAG